MRLADQLPRYDFVERHEIRVGVPPDAAFAAVRRADEEEATGSLEVGGAGRGP